MISVMWAGYQLATVVVPRGVIVVAVVKVAVILAVVLIDSNDTIVMEKVIPVATD